MPTKKPTLSDRVAQLERQLAEMRDLLAPQSKAVAVPEPAKAMAAAAAAAASAPVPAVVAKPVAAPVPKPAPKQEEGVSPEILAVITAAVAHFLGKSFRIRSARLVHPAGSNPWAQQGRVFIQASHNLALQR